MLRIPSSSKEFLTALRNPTGLLPSYRSTPATLMSSKRLQLRVEQSTKSLPRNSGRACSVSRYGLTEIPSDLSMSIVAEVCGSPSPSLVTNHSTLSSVTSRQLMTRGLYSMSAALTLSSQAISSRAVSSMPSQPAPAMKSLSHASLDSLVSPAWTVNTGVSGISGLSCHSSDSMSGTLTTVPGRLRAKSTPAQRPSRAIIPSSPNCVSSHSGIRTCPGTRVLCSSTPVPSSCRRAWMKYRVSVHSPAWSSVTTMSPASPVKPLSHCTCFHRSAGYSLPWGSPPVTSTASQFLARMSPRSLSILSR